ncbi:MAG: hypothetical protein ACK5IQ_03425 [Bacteroidales bacterium]
MATPWGKIHHQSNGTDCRAMIPPPATPLLEGWDLKLATSLIVENNINTHPLRTALAQMISSNVREVMPCLSKVGRIR